MIRSALVLATLIATSAFAEGQTWSVVGARTLPLHETHVEVGLGFPSEDIAVIHGVTSSLQLGGRVGFVYAYRSLPSTLVLGITLEGLLKYKLYDSGRVSLGLTFEPGFDFYFFAGNPVATTIALPVGFRVGIAASSAFGLGLSFEVPIWFRLNEPGANIPLLLGVGLEYFVTSRLAIFGKFRAGPTLSTNSPALFTMNIVVGVSWAF